MHNGRVIFIYPHSIAYFNPIEQWLSAFKSFLLGFAPTTTSMIDRIIAFSLNKHEFSTFNKLES